MTEPNRDVKVTEERVERSRMGTYRDPDVRPAYLQAGDALRADFPRPRPGQVVWMPEPKRPGVLTWLRWLLVDFGWFPGPSRDDWRLVNADVESEIDQLVDQLVTELRTSRAVGPKMKQRIAAAHGLIVYKRHYRWRE